MTAHRAATAAALPDPASRFAALFSATSGYDAIDSKNKRKAAPSILRSEDSELQDMERRKLLATGRDLHRNFSVLAWMVRRHLDYVTTFNFQARTGNKELDKKIEALIRDWSKRENFDIAGRHTLQRAIRLAEARRTIDGDVLAARMADGRTQWIEGDRIRAGTGIPETVDPATLVHGIQIDTAGRAIAYAISRRGGSALNSAGTFVFEKMLPARNAYLHAYLDRFDQVRGISPVATALNELRDTYEGLDLARCKMKVDQLFALAFYRNAADDDALPGTAANSDDGSGYEVDFGRGPVLLDLDPGDRAEFLTSANPSNQFQTFITATIQIALKALDLPYSFFAENYTNYSGARQALLQYEQSAATKRADNVALLEWLTDWRLALFVADGQLPGVDPAQIAHGYQWISRGQKWVDPLKEILADVQAIGAGLNTRTRILREQGLDFDDVVAELAHEAETLKAAGLPLNLDQNNAQIAALTSEPADNAEAAAA